MLRRYSAFLSLALVLPLAASPQYGAPKPQPNKDKTIWNYDGGLVMMTDGAIPDGPCFRLTGRLTAPIFFDNLKRIDTNTGPVIHRGHDLVTEFPDRMRLLFELYDQPCFDQMNGTGPRVYLNKAIVSSLHLGFFWKHGVELRPAKGISVTRVEAHLIPPYDSENSENLPEKYEWWFDLEVPSAGVPVTDSLVLVLLTRDRHIAARVAARM
jgi:hypothetical protein